MQKLELVVMVGKKGVNGITYEMTKQNAVVASTKSKNNLVDEINEKGLDIVKSVKAVEFFLDRAKTEKAVETLVNETCEKENDETKKAVMEHIVNALLSACVLWKPSTRSK